MKKPSWVGARLAILAPALILAACSSTASEPLVPEGPSVKMTMLEYSPSDPAAATNAAGVCAAQSLHAQFVKIDPRPLGAVSLYKCQ